MAELVKIIDQALHAAAIDLLSISSPFIVLPNRSVLFLKFKLESFFILENFRNFVTRKFKIIFKFPKISFQKLT